MPYCAIYGCTNHNQNSTVKFYTFPKDKALCQKWKHLCYREDHINVRTATICSVHFSSDSFDTPLKYKLLNYRPKNLRDLKKDAIPSLHLPRPQRKECKSSRENRMERKEQRGILKNILIESNLKSTFQNSEPSSTHSDEDNESRQDLSLTPINSRAEDGQMIVLMTSVNEEITSLKEENRQLKTANDILVQTNQELKYENQSLRSELENLKTYISTEVNNKIHESLSRIFTPGQITSLLSQQQPKKILWKNDDIASAISLRSISSKCYRYLRIKLHYPLPAPSTLRKWIARIEFSPGILHNVLTIMKNKSNKADNFRKIVALSFDEMSLSKLMDFDTKKEMVIGPHNNVQVVFVRAINANWKQPIFYNFDEAMKRDVLFDIINSVERAGFHVISITSDMGPGNRALWRELNISPSNCSFSNPFDDKRPIFVFADAPHLLKLARNHFVTKGFTFDDKVASKDCLLEMLDQAAKHDLKVPFKLTESQIFISDKQRVKTAAQLFSHANAKALEYYGQRNLLDKNSTSWEPTAEVLLKFNNWFDVFNSSIPHTPQIEKNGYGLNMIQQNQIINEMLCLMERLQVRGSKDSDGI
ncbi:hypothetical protein GE061_012116 [Apolygus lucorum]|uniref:THAP-type domain-containing protein n=1 Tax=Apolygus lucorum TaxID=248454 RepID=A0A8S9XRN4_APOLU|nr:hypothetical protein GE061_012116 [Apolygus lucorum]